MRGVSQSDKLLEDARRDWTALGGEEHAVIPLTRHRQGADIAQQQGILFATYATLRLPARQGKPSRLEQVVGWLAGGRPPAAPGLLKLLTSRLTSCFKISSRSLNLSISRSCASLRRRQRASLASSLWPADMMSADSGPFSRSSVSLSKYHYRRHSRRRPGRSARHRDLQRVDRSSWAGATSRVG